MSIKYFILILSAIQLSHCAEDTVRIVASNIDLKQEEHVIATLFSLLETESNNDVIGRKLIAEMDTKFGKSWLAMISTNTTNSGIYSDQDMTTSITINFRALTLTLIRTSVTTTTNTTTNSTLRAHVINQISRARASTYRTQYTYNISGTALTNNITNIVKIFTTFTERFESNACLSVTEAQIESDPSLSCYSLISRQILNAYPGNYLVTVGESASYYTIYNNNPSIGIEFTLGPLYFEIYKCQC